MTERLYCRDPELRQFEARVILVIDCGSNKAVLLDQTAFFPEGGGQPGDRGTLNSCTVVNTTMRDDGQILHWVSDSGDVPQVGDEVTGEIDAQRRFDHSQQHSAQHLLSQALQQTAGWCTTGFHLGSDTSTVDLSTEEAEWEDLLKGERLANQMVFRDITRWIDIYSCPEDLPAVLRGETGDDVDDYLSGSSGGLRVVSFGDFDATLCGGTHVFTTGEIGLIKVLKTETVRRCVRLHFVAGWRAVQFFEEYRDTVDQLTGLFTTGREELIEVAEKMRKENTSLLKENSRLRSRLLAREAEDLLDEAEGLPDGTPIVADILQGGMQYIQKLAGQLQQKENVVVLLAATEDGTAQFVFCRPPRLPVDCSELLRELVSPLGGGGGGHPDRAQGGGVSSSEAKDIVQRAREVFEDAVDK